MACLNNSAGSQETEICYSGIRGIVSGPFDRGRVVWQRGIIYKGSVGRELVVRPCAVYFITWQGRNLCGIIVKSGYPQGSAGMNFLLCDLNSTLRSPFSLLIELAAWGWLPGSYRGAESLNAFFKIPVLCILTSEMSALVTISVLRTPKGIRGILVKLCIVVLVRVEKSVTLIFILGICEEIPRVLYKKGGNS